ncbi:MFS transporter [Kineococcus aurantiacus]|uniref:DHA2 family multidrug resistance protein-like MFS transporter n=1 Tax=Kineococcus aurantiacus TaxID=37633 RepID=A0A7Y9J147_9ACTN|nr:MFS transporter [Kineococcus aurantiacus]NYD22792.1 DHA2 family multidrug resistance protein-like MFS transporter [Kineococcus aurantiacus]
MTLSTTQPTPVPTRPTSRQWAALAVLVLPVLLISIDMTVLSFALPAISEAVSPTGTQLLWIVDGYSLAIAGLLVTMGTLGDRHGARKLLLAGSAGFGVVSLLAAFADSATALIAARVALGVFGATLMPSTLSLLRSTFTDREQRRTAFAVWAGGFAAGGAVGPIVGGWLLERFWWGSVFLLNVPFMVALLVLTPLVVREHRTPGTHGRLDLTSVAVSVLALTSLVYGVKTLAEHGPTLVPVSATALGVALAVVFVRRQQRLAEPLLDVDLFRLPVFRASVLANLMSVCGMTGMLFAVSQHLQLVLGLRPLHAGLLLLPGAVVTFAAGLLAARLARRLRLDLLITAGLLLGSAGYAVMALLGSGTGTGPAVQLAVAFAVLCAGAGLAETLTNDAILSAAPASRTGAASAISETAYEVGAVLGTTVLGSVLNAVYRHRVDVPAGAEQARETLGAAVQVAATRPDGQALLDSARAAFTHGLDATAAAGLVLTAAAALLVWRSLRPRGVPGAVRA